MLTPWLSWLRNWYLACTVGLKLVLPGLNSPTTDARMDSFWMGTISTDWPTWNAEPAATWPTVCARKKVLGAAALSMSGNMRSVSFAMTCDGAAGGGATESSASAAPASNSAEPIIQGVGFMYGPPAR